jgi:hypothetical protein
LEWSLVTYLQIALALAFSLGVAALGGILFDRINMWRSRPKPPAADQP